MASNEKPYTRVVRALRHLRGMSQRDLARASGVTVRTIRSIEAEGTDPRACTLLQVLNALDATPADRAQALASR